MNKELTPFTNYDPSVFRPTEAGVSALYPGFPTESKNEVLTLSTFNIQYIPKVGDLVIGTIKTKTSESYILDIGAPLDITLGGLEFDNATKRNKPNLKQGSVVFCRVESYSKHLGGKASCINKTAKSSNQLG